VINKLSNDVKANIADAGKDTFKKLYGIEFDKAEVFGSFEFIEEFGDFTPLTLDYLWQNKKFEKLSGGTYCMELDFNGRMVYLINGFHPRQIAHFTEEGRSIITFTLVGDLDWSVARNDFIGSTLPQNAKEGSLRRYFLNNRKKLGLPSISSSWNGVHLSAGPVEGLIELMRYNSNFQAGDTKTPEDYQFGNILMEHFDDDTIYDIMNNAVVDYNGEKISIFDLTEEKNSDEAIDLLKQVF
jgi:hypothetical protein